MLRLPIDTALESTAGRSWARRNRAAASCRWVSVSILGPRRRLTRCRGTVQSAAVTFPFRVVTRSGLP